MIRMLWYELLFSFPKTYTGVLKYLKVCPSDSVWLFDSVCVSFLLAVALGLCVAMWLGVVYIEPGVAIELVMLSDWARLCVCLSDWLWLLDWVWQLKWVWLLHCIWLLDWCGCQTGMAVILGKANWLGLTMGLGVAIGLAVTIRMGVCIELSVRGYGLSKWKLNLHAWCIARYN